MDVLVTGGAGFIGSHLVGRLLARGDRVCVIDNISTGSIKNLESYIGNPHLEVIVDTACNPVLMEEQIRKVDQVYHLAAPVGVKYIMERPVLTILDNLRAVDVVFEFCNKYRKKVFLASTSEVYGKNLDHLGTAEDFLGEEDYQLQGSTQNQRWAYAATKAVDEFLAFAYHKEFGMPVVVGRLFNTVGPRQTGMYGMVVPTFIRQALSGGPITVYGDGTQSRSFLHVNDAIDGFEALMDNPEAVGQVFNIGHGSEISILDLAKLVREYLSVDVKIKVIDYATAYGEGFEDMHRRAPDISKIQNLVGFQTKFSLEDVIDDVAKEYRRKLGPQ